MVSVMIMLVMNFVFTATVSLVFSSRIRSEITLLAVSTARFVAAAVHRRLDQPGHDALRDGAGERDAERVGQDTQQPRLHEPERAADGRLLPLLPPVLAARLPAPRLRQGSLPADETVSGRPTAGRARRGLSRGGV